VVPPVNKITLMLLHLLVESHGRARIQFLCYLRLLGILFAIFLQLIGTQSRYLFSAPPGLRGGHSACSLLRCGLLSRDGLLIELIIDLPACLLQCDHILLVFNPYQGILEAFPVLVQLLLPLIVNDLILSTRPHLRILDPEVVPIRVKHYVFLLHKVPTLHLEQ
jgi:hypothetical protein